MEPALERSAEEWYKVVGDNKEDLINLTRKYGAILFKRFPMENPACFDKFAGIVSIHTFISYFYAFLANNIAE